MYVLYKDPPYSTKQPHRTQNCENTSEEPNWLLEKLIHITNFENPSNSRCTCKNLDAIIFFVDFSNTQKEDGPNTTRRRPTQRNHHSHKNAI